MVKEKKDKNIALLLTKALAMPFVSSLDTVKPELIPCKNRSPFHDPASVAAAAGGIDVKRKVDKRFIRTITIAPSLHICRSAIVVTK